MESDFLKSDIGGSLEWGLWEDLFDSDVIWWHVFTVRCKSAPTLTRAILEAQL